MKHTPTTCEDDFGLDRYLVALRSECAFYATISRRMYKVCTRDITTAGVAWDEARESIILYYNPDLFKTMTSRQVRGILEHEFLHFVFMHITTRRKKPHWLWNMATDLAINSVIVDSAKKSDSKDEPLPEWTLLPGRDPCKSPRLVLSPREGDEEEPKKVDQDDPFVKANEAIGAKIATFPHLLTSEQYYFALLEEAQNQLQELINQGVVVEGGVDGIPLPGMDSSDDHSGWDNISEDARERIENSVKSALEQAVKDADSSSNGWGNIPASIRDEIRRSISNIVPWKRVLRQFVGHLLPGGRTSSIKRINRRYPYIHPGVKRNRIAKLLVAVDQSGSVDNKMLSELFAVLGSLTKLVEIDWVPFDAECRSSDIKRWRKGGQPPTTREKCGGTDFDAPTRIVNDPKNRGRWDGFLIATDGECSSPPASRVKRGWVIAKGQKLLFDTPELVINLDHADEFKRGSVTR